MYDLRIDPLRDRLEPTISGERADRDLNPAQRLKKPLHHRNASGPDCIPLSRPAYLRGMEEGSGVRGRAGLEPALSGVKVLRLSSRPTPHRGNRRDSNSLAQHSQCCASTTSASITGCAILDNKKRVRRKSFTPVHDNDKRRRQARSSTDKHTLPSVNTTHCSCRAGAVSLFLSCGSTCLINMIISLI
jgi:hypothetical protein